MPKFEINDIVYLKSDIEKGKIKEQHWVEAVEKDHGMDLYTLSSGQKAYESELVTKKEGLDLRLKMIAAEKALIEAML